MNEKHSKLISDLTRKTMANELNWEVSAVNDQFKLRMRNGIIVLDMYPSSRQYSISILDSNGAEVDKIMSIPNHEYLEPLKNLYSLVTTSRSRKTLDSILDELQ